jgi:heme/copper-type cytochrome/quinol oxidase subunit 2
MENQRGLFWYIAKRLLHRRTFDQWIEESWVDRVFNALWVFSGVVLVGVIYIAAFPVFIVRQIFWRIPYNWFWKRESYLEDFWTVKQRTKEATDGR